MTDLIKHLRREASKQDMLACEDMLQAADALEKAEEALREIDEWTDNKHSPAQGIIAKVKQIARAALEPTPALCDTWPDKLDELP